MQKHSLEFVWTSARAATDSGAVSFLPGDSKIVAKCEAAVESVVRDLSRGKVAIASNLISMSGFSIHFVDSCSSKGQGSFNDPAFDHAGGLLLLIASRADFHLNKTLVGDDAQRASIEEAVRARMLPVDRLIHALGSISSVALQSRSENGTSLVKLPHPSLVDISAKNIRKPRKDLGIVEHRSDQQIILSTRRIYLVSNATGGKLGDTVKVCGKFIEGRPYRTFTSPLEAKVEVIRAAKQLVIPLEVL